MLISYTQPRRYEKVTHERQLPGYDIVLSVIAHHGDFWLYSRSRKQINRPIRQPVVNPATSILAAAAALVGEWGVLEMKSIRAFMAPNTVVRMSND